MIIFCASSSIHHYNMGMPEGPNAIPLSGEPKHFYGFKGRPIPGTVPLAWAPKLQILASVQLSPLPQLQVHLLHSTLTAS